MDRSLGRTANSAGALRTARTSFPSSHLAGVAAEFGKSPGQRSESESKKSFLSTVRDLAAASTADEKVLWRP